MIERTKDGAALIMPSDTVLHKPTGETWVVCGVDHQRGDLIPCGYPFPTLAKVADCELVEEHYSQEGQPESWVRALREHGYDRFVVKSETVPERLVETDDNEPCPRMSLQEAVLWLKKYQGYEPLTAEDCNYPGRHKHFFDLTDETVDVLLEAIEGKEAATDGEEI